MNQCIKSGIWKVKADCRKSCFIDNYNKSRESYLRLVTPDFESPDYQSKWRVYESKIDTFKDNVAHIIISKDKRKTNSFLDKCISVILKDLLLLDYPKIERDVIYYSMVATADLRISISA